MFTTTDFYFLIPEIFLLISLLMTTSFSIWYSDSSAYYRSCLSSQILLLSIYILIIVFFLFSTILSYDTVPTLYFEFYKTSRELIQVKMGITVLTILILIISYNQLVEYPWMVNIKSSEFSILILISTFAAFLIVSSNHLIFLYLSLELQGLCCYLLAGIQKNESSLEGSLKYYILGALASVILLFACSLIYGIVGTMNLIDIQSYLQMELVHLHKNGG